MDSRGQREGLAQHVFDMFAKTHDEANQLYDVLFEFALNNKKLFKDCSDFDEMTSEIRKGVTNKELLTLLHDYVPSEDMPDKLSDFMMWSPVLAFHEIENIYLKEGYPSSTFKLFLKDKDAIDLIYKAGIQSEPRHACFASLLFKSPMVEHKIVKEKMGSAVFDELKNSDINDWDDILEHLFEFDTKLTGSTNEFLNSITVLNKFSKSWDKIKSSSIKPVNDSNASDSDIEDVYNGDVSTIESLPQQPSVEDENKAYELVNPDVLNQLDEQEAQNYKRFLVRNYGRAINIITKNVKIVHSNLQGSNLDSFKQNLRYINGQFSKYNMSASNSALTDAYKSVKGAINNYQIDSVGTAMDAIVHGYIPALKKFKNSSCYTQSLASSMAYNQQLSFLGAACRLEEPLALNGGAKNKHQPNQVQTQTKTITKTKIVRVAQPKVKKTKGGVRQIKTIDFTDPIYKEDSTASGKFLKKLKDAQIKFNTEYTQLYIQLLHKLETITQDQISAMSDSAIYEFVGQFDKILISNPETSYKISGLYKTKDLNRLYVNALQTLINTIQANPGSCFSQVLPIVNSIKMLCESTMKVYMEAKKEFMESSKSSSEMLLQNELIKVIKIPCGLTQKQIISMKDTCKKIYLFAQNRAGVKNSVVTTESMLKEYLSKSTDRNKMIDNYFSTIEQGTRYKLSTYQRHDQMEMIKPFITMKLIIIDETKKAYKWLNEFMEKFLVTKRLEQLGKVVLTEEQINTVCHAYTTLTTYSRSSASKLMGEYRKLSRANEQNLLSYFKLFKLARSTFEEVGSLDFIEKLYKTFGIDDSKTNWIEFKSKIIGFLANNLIWFDFYTVDDAIGEYNHYDPNKVVPGGITLRQLIDTNKPLYTQFMNKNIDIYNIILQNQISDINDINKIIDRYNLAVKEINEIVNSDVAKLDNIVAPAAPPADYAATVQLSDDRMVAVMNIAILGQKSFATKQIIGLGLSNKDNAVAPIFKGFDRYLIEALYTPVIQVIDKYINQRYVGTLDFSLHVSDMMQGGRKVNGSSVFDVISTHEAINPRINPQTTQFYISAFVILKFYITQYYSQNNNANQESVRLKISKLSTIANLKQVIDERSYNFIDDYQGFRFFVSDMNDIWNSTSGQTIKDHSASSVDYLVSELNSMLVFGDEETVLRIQETLGGDATPDISLMEFSKVKQLLEASIIENSNALILAGLNNNRILDRMFNKYTSKIQSVSDGAKPGVLKEILSNIKDGKGQDSETDFSVFVDVCSSPFHIIANYYSQLISKVEYIIKKQLLNNVVGSAALKQAVCKSLYGYIQANNGTKMQMITALLNFSGDRPKTLFDLYQTINANFYRDVDQTIHNIMNYPGLNDDQVSDVMERIHDKFAQMNQNLKGIINAHKDQLINGTLELDKVFIPLMNNADLYPQFYGDVSVKVSLAENYYNNANKPVAFFTFTKFITFALAKQNPSWFVPQLYAELLRSSHELNGTTFTDVVNMGSGNEAVLVEEKDNFGNIFVNNKQKIIKVLDVFTSDVLYRTQSQTAINTTTAATASPIYATKIVSIIPFLVKLLDEHLTYITKGQEAYRAHNKIINARTEIQILKQILLSVYNEFLPYSQNVQFLSAGTIKFKHYISEIRSIYDNDKLDFSLLIEVPEIFEWICPLYLTDLGINYKNYDRFEEYKQNISLITNDVTFIEQFQSTLVALAKTIVQIIFGTINYAITNVNNGPGSNGIIMIGGDNATLLSENALYLNNSVTGKPFDELKELCDKMNQFETAELDRFSILTEDDVNNGYFEDYAKNGVNYELNNISATNAKKYKGIWTKYAYDTFDKKNYKYDHTEETYENRDQQLNINISGDDDTNSYMHHMIRLSKALFEPIQVKYTYYPNFVSMNVNNTPTINFGKGGITSFDTQGLTGGNKINWSRPVRAMRGGGLDIKYDNKDAYNQSIKDISNKFRNLSRHALLASSTDNTITNILNIINSLSGILAFARMDDDTTFTALINGNHPFINKTGLEQAVKNDNIDACKIDGLLNYICKQCTNSQLCKKALPLIDGTNPNAKTSFDNIMQYANEKDATALKNAVTNAASGIVQPPKKGTPPPPTYADDTDIQNYINTWNDRNNDAANYIKECNEYKDTNKYDHTSYVSNPPGHTFIYDCDVLITNMTNYMNSVLNGTLPKTRYAIGVKTYPKSDVERDTQQLNAEYNNVYSSQLSDEVADYAQKNKKALDPEAAIRGDIIKNYNTFKVNVDTVIKNYSVRINNIINNYKTADPTSKSQLQTNYDNLYNYLTQQQATNIQDNPVYWFALQADHLVYSNNTNTLLNTCDDDKKIQTHVNTGVCTTQDLKDAVTYNFTNINTQLNTYCTAFENQHASLNIGAGNPHQPPNPVSVDLDVTSGETFESVEEVGNSILFNEILTLVYDDMRFSTSKEEFDSYIKNGKIMDEKGDYSFIVYKPSNDILLDKKDVHINDDNILNSLKGITKGIRNAVYHMYQNKPIFDGLPESDYNLSKCMQLFGTNGSNQFQKYMFNLTLRILMSRQYDQYYLCTPMSSNRIDRKINYVSTFNSVHKLLKTCITDATSNKMKTGIVEATIYNVKSTIPLKVEFSDPIDETPNTNVVYSDYGNKDVELDGNKSQITYETISMLASKDVNRNKIDKEMKHNTAVFNNYPKYSIIDLLNIDMSELKSYKDMYNERKYMMTSPSVHKQYMKFVCKVYSKLKTLNENYVSAMNFVNNLSLNTDSTNDYIERYMQAIYTINSVTHLQFLPFVIGGSQEGNNQISIVHTQYEINKFAEQVYAEINNLMLNIANSIAKLIQILVKMSSRLDRSPEDAYFGIANDILGMLKNIGGITLPSNSLKDDIILTTINKYTHVFSSDASYISDISLINSVINRCIFMHNKRAKYYNLYNSYVESLVNYDSCPNAGFFNSLTVAPISIVESGWLASMMYEKFIKVNDDVSGKFLTKNDEFKFIETVDRTKLFNCIIKRVGRAVAKYKITLPELAPNSTDIKAYNSTATINAGATQQIDCTLCDLYDNIDEIINLVKPTPNINNTLYLLSIVKQLRTAIQSLTKEDTQMINETQIYIPVLDRLPEFLNNNQTLIDIFNSRKIWAILLAEFTMRNTLGYVIPCSDFTTLASEYSKSDFKTAYLSAIQGQINTTITVNSHDGKSTYISFIDSSIYQYTSGYDYINNGNLADGLPLIYYPIMNFELLNKAMDLNLNIPNNISEEDRTSWNYVIPAYSKENNKSLLDKDRRYNINRLRNYLTECYSLVTEPIWDDGVYGNIMNIAGTLEQQVYFAKPENRLYKFWCYKTDGIVDNNSYKVMRNSVFGIFADQDDAANIIYIQNINNMLYYEYDPTIEQRIDNVILDINMMDIFSFEPGKKYAITSVMRSDSNLQYYSLISTSADKYIKLNNLQDIKGEQVMKQDDLMNELTSIKIRPIEVGVSGIASSDYIMHGGFIGGELGGAILTLINRDGKDALDYYVKQETTFKTIISPVGNGDIERLIISYYQKPLLSFNSFFNKNIYVQLIYNSALFKTGLLNLIKHFSNGPNVQKFTSLIRCLASPLFGGIEGATYVKKMSQLVNNTEENYIKLEDIIGLNRLKDDETVYGSEHQPTTLRRFLSTNIQSVGQSVLDYIELKQDDKIILELMKVDSCNVAMYALCSFMKALSYKNLQTEARETYADNKIAEPFDAEDNGGVF